jgi:hypothetical protein
VNLTAKFEHFSLFFLELNICLNITKITHKFLHVSAEYFLCGKATLIFSFQFQFLPIGCSAGDTNEVNG